jgi:predicted helicase
LFFDKPFVESPGLSDRFFPEENTKNVILTIAGTGGVKDFYVLATDTIRDLDTYGGCQCFPLYYYEERLKSSPSLFDATGESEYIRRDGVSDFILERAKKVYGKNVSKEDIFYYVYGILHSPDYRTAFANDLKKMLPRIPLVEYVRDFWKFSKAGRALADLHINYEEVPPYEGVEVAGASTSSATADLYRVEKMRFPKKNQKETIIYNSKIVVSNIPEKAYEYVVNGKSAIEWIMERYAVTTHKASGIKNDPNDWADEVGNPRYILDLLLSVINVSVQTLEIVEGLPKMEFDTN